MSEERVIYSTAIGGLLKPEANHVTIEVDRTELEQERRHLLGRLQQLNRLLGYPPLLTGKEQRRQTE
jgi:hypothetical protein